MNLGNFRAHRCFCSYPSHSEFTQHKLWVGTLLMFLNHSDLCHELANTSSHGMKTSNGIPSLVMVVRKGQLKRGGECKPHFQLVILYQMRINSHQVDFPPVPDSLGKAETCGGLGCAGLQHLL